MSLTAEEREVVVIYNDAERAWHVYSDSVTMRGTIRRLAKQVGAEVHQVGDHGIEFMCPAGSLRLSAKRRLSAKQLDAARESGRRLQKTPGPSQNAKFAPAGQATLGR